MRYTVIWKREAERRLAQLWVNASERSAITRAADEVDRLLRTNAHERGEARSDGRRVLTVSPPGVLFRVDPGDRMVFVIAVWQFRTHS